MATNPDFEHQILYANSWKCLGFKKYTLSQEGPKQQAVIKVGCNQARLCLNSAAGRRRRTLSSFKMVRDPVRKSLDNAERVTDSGAGAYGQNDSAGTKAATTKRSESE